MKKEYLFALLVFLLLVGTTSADYIETFSRMDLSTRELDLKIINKNIIWSSKEDLTRYVNPFIGTGIYSYRGAERNINCYPGTVVPFGMVQLSPDTGNNVAGYFYEDSNIEGFSHTHLSGCGDYGLGNILTMATTGDVKTTEIEYKSSFSHDLEVAYPGYYMVMLEDYNIKAELTVTARCGFQRYTFPDSDNAHILIDVTHTLEDDEPIDAFVEIVDNNAITGYVTIPEPFTNGKKPYTTFFTAKFSKPFSSYGTWKDKILYYGSDSGSGDDIGAYVNFSTYENEIIKVKVGISYVSEEQAYLNLENEITNWDFDFVKNNARDAWNNRLNVINVEGGTNDQKVIFYTALYHSFLMPHIFSDVNGRYIGFDDKIHIAENYTEYATFSLWDTFRSEHPLLVLLQPERQNDMIKSLIDQYKYGGWFPKWPFLNRYTNCMIGDHATSVIVDSYLKGVNNFDVSTAYEGMRKSAMELPPDSHDYEGRTGLPYYKKLGYIPYNKDLESVSKTLENAYDDWCLAQIAKALGKDDDYELFMKRSNYYKNLFDPFTKFMRGRHSIGFRKILFIPSIWHDFTEGNSWMYTWFVPHDIEGLIDLMGKKRFIRRLDYFFNKFAHPILFAPFSHYWHGNEQANHAPYLYNYAGKPWKTQDLVRKIMDELYGTGIDGIPGNEDCGQLSAWYIFSAMGFYPVCPGNTTYQIGSPIFNKVTIHLSDQYYNGNDFVILANNVSAENKYIQSATLNGESLNRLWINHSEIVNGGVLILETGDNPSPVTLGKL